MLAAGPGAMWGCDTPNGTAGGVDLPLCRELPLALWAFSLLYLLVGLPLGLGYNALLVLANLHSRRTMSMPDVYFVNMAVAGLVLGVLAPAYLLGPAHTHWALWRLSSEVQITLLTLFHVSALVTMYSAALLSLDCYIERALPRTYMSSVYNTRHVCGFVWGGALLTSFSSLLFHICSHVSSRLAECADMRSTEAADAIMVLVGYVVPALATLYALVLIARLRKEDTPLGHGEAGRLEPSEHRLLGVTVGTQLGLWTPYYLTLLGQVLVAAKGRPMESHYLGVLPLVKDLARLLAFSSSSVTPLIYRHMDKSFPSKLRRLAKRLQCRPRHCAQDQGGIQQVGA
ncbi:PREDICTED: probable G-protein coupled receptor 146 [Chrysochloris asiatica]|uniref:Probable G-protein coupled receptor 146 n=1 Tax=Chrysochloris asiatica TaxID=185453 RepID=A0A9B0T9Z4_CHRAS|nr:PREDICTED: probable G-protein coupled receptor 146 [Chrysochloris asiatica]